MEFFTDFIALVILGGVALSTILLFSAILIVLMDNKIKIIETIISSVLYIISVYGVTLGYGKVVSQTEHMMLFYIFSVLEILIIISLLESIVRKEGSLRKAIKKIG